MQDGSANFMHDFTVVARDLIRQAVIEHGKSLRFPSEWLGQLDDRAKAWCDMMIGIKKAHIEGDNFVIVASIATDFVFSLVINGIYADAKR